MGFPAEEGQPGEQAGFELILFQVAERADRREDDGCECEADPDEEEWRHPLDRILDHREGRAPDQGDADESKLPSIRLKAFLRAHEVVRYTRALSRWSRTPSRR